ncbi:MAG: hypothetical protein AAB834_04060 [Patescibacteria group bacterium]
MKGYGASLGIAAILGLADFFYWFFLSIGADSQLVWSGVNSALSGACAFFVVLAGWGGAGLALSKIKENLRETLVQENVRISRSSWHYRLQATVCPANTYGDITKVCSECEYWARLANGLFTQPPIYILCIVVIWMVTAIGWFFGAKPSSEHFFRGSQWKGPVALTLIVLAGVSLALWHWGFPSVPAIPASSPAATGYIRIVIGIIVGGFVLFFLWTKAVWPAFRNLASFVGAKLVGLCRQTTFTD